MYLTSQRSLPLCAALVGTLLVFSATQASAVTVLPGLLGSDLTDPENNINDNTADLLGGTASTGTGFDWTSFSSNQEDYFGDPVVISGDPPGADLNNEGARDIFDNKTGGGDNKYCCGQNLIATVGFGQAYTLTHFTMTNGNDTTPGRDAAVWSIQGSNDGTTFTDIYVVNNPGVSIWTTADGDNDVNETLRFDSGSDFAAPAAYSFFRLNLTASTSDALLHLGELELFGTPVPEPSSLGLLAAGALFVLRRRRRTA